MAVTALSKQGHDAPVYQPRLAVAADAAVLHAARQLRCLLWQSRWPDTAGVVGRPYGSLLLPDGVRIE